MESVNTVSQTLINPDIPHQYVRGFIVSSKEIEPPKNFQEKHSIDGGLHLYADADARLMAIKWPGFSVFTVGFLVDTECPDSSLPNILRSLIEALAAGRAAFFRRLADLGGRYAIIATDKDGTFVVGDAGGARSIFYTESSASTYVIASHASLVASIIGKKEIDIAANLQTFGEGYRARNWPGRLSRYQSVFALTPNTYLDVGARRPRRFYPLDALPERPPAQAASIAIRYLKNAASNFKLNYLTAGKREVVVFLTGGIDSRLIMASMHGLEDHLVAFSYDNKGAHAADIQTAANIASLLNIPHIIHNGDLIENRSVSEWAAKNSGAVYSSSKTVVNFCANHLSDFKFSMRGNFGEISRGVLSSRTAFIDQPSRYLARTWFRGSERHKVILDAFDDYVEASEIGLSPWPIRILNYWEHRHATWHAATLNELDIAFDTFNIMNSRTIIEAMCGVSLADQKSCAVHRKAIEMMNPQLLSIPLEKKAF